MNTTTNTRGVSEAMVERAFQAMDAVFAAKWPDREPLDDAEKALAYEGLRAAIEDVLSAPEPAAQGDAEALELLAAEYERWGSSVIAKALRANGVGNNAFDYEVAIRAVKRALAPPAQPAERVPDGTVPRAVVEVAQGDLHMLKKAIEARDPWPELLVRVTDTERDLRTALAASPAPSPARGDGGEV